MSLKPQRPPFPASLDNLTLSRKEGWFAYVNAPTICAPERLTRTQLKRLGEGALAEYDARRRRWHANLGPIKTPQLANLHEDLWDIVDSGICQGV